MANISKKLHFCNMGFIYVFCSTSVEMFFPNTERLFKTFFVGDQRNDEVTSHCPMKQNVLTPIIFCQNID